MALKGLEPGKRAALLVVEMQNGIINPAFTAGPLVDQVEARAIVPKINSLAAEFRAHGYPVVHCIISARPGFAGWNNNCYLAHHILRENRLISGSVYAALHDGIDFQPEDYIEERHHGMSAFTGTRLAPLLRAHRVDTVVLSGVSTNVALIGSAIEAVGLGYQALLAEDCSAGATAESHAMQIGMNLSAVASVGRADEIIAALKNQDGR
ncbi:nicotinamidase-related amidase [Novosphingobium hassiacum]|uniref:Nicotinamidase-related amidase n=1 Tax=Novosphingobium hassiacum TaxID=173676 RepID=A0A7W5ZXI4_9SPHN|nr:cysteine hydrolase [Novosphingobium hassiacum]MBB3860953.1 nicotinamidase-related amidase [Novosphingobium hassiacum]